MRNKIVAVIILLIALSLIVIGIIQGQNLMLNSIYENMVAVT
ncbi:MAG: hypothetical protein ACFE9C_15930 [Candidatus Hodarchaeota archaeon]